MQNCYGSVWTTWMMYNTPHLIIQVKYTPPYLVESAHKELCPKCDIYVAYKPNTVQ